MTIKRIITADFREAIDKQESEVFPLAFLEITHSSLTKPIRIVSNSENIKLNVSDADDDAYVGFDFSISILSDGERPPSAQLQVQNIDGKMGALLLDVFDPPKVNLTIYSSDQFDESVFPHVPFDPDPPWEYRALNLYLIDTSIKADVVTGTLKTWEYTQETYPSIFATEDRTPGLFW